MLLHGKNDNVIITNLSYFCMHQDKENMRALQRDKYIFGVGV